MLALANRLGAEKATPVLHALIQNLESVNDDGALASFLLLNLTHAEPLEKAVECLAESALLPRMYSVTKAESYVPAVVPFLLSLIKSAKGKGVKAAAVNTLLAVSKNLGPAVSARYILPGLAACIGHPLSHSSPPPWPDVSHMHAALGVTSLFGVATSEVVQSLVKVVMDTLPERAEGALKADGPEKPQAVSALVETIYVLHAALPYLTPEAALYHYMTSPQLPVHQMLLVLLSLLSSEDPWIAGTEAGSLLGSVCVCIRKVSMREERSGRAEKAHSFPISRSVPDHASSLLFPYAVARRCFYARRHFTGRLDRSLHQLAALVDVAARFRFFRRRRTCPPQSFPRLTTSGPMCTTFTLTPSRP